jgi:4-amino-4-deoxy-L-arabinose transferase-like glycosyltransferase
MDGRATPIGTSRRLAWAAAAALALAAFNLGYRLDREMLDVWDESSFATSALEMMTSGWSAATTFGGTLDYYNSKPPLNVWLITASFHAFGAGVVALRLPVVVCAWLTVLATQWWTRRTFGDRPALLATLVLATTYGLLYVHSGRTANADAPLTLAITLTVLAVWAARERPWMLVATGGLAAAAVLLKGPGAVAYLLPILAVDLLAPPSRRRWQARVVAALAGLVPVALYVAARWRIDGTAFLLRMVEYDVVTRLQRPIDDHAGAWWFYLDVLQRHHYDWLVVLLAALWVAPPAAAQIRTWAGADPGRRHTLWLLAAWATATFLLPSAITTKTAWYLNGFYPLFAMLVALAVSSALDRLASGGRGHRRTAFVLLIALAAVVAESKLAWRSFRQLDLSRSPQELLLRQDDAIAGAAVFATGCPMPEAFLARRAGASCVEAPTTEAALAQARHGDVWLGRAPVTHPTLRLVDANRGAWLYRIEP